MKKNINEYQILDSGDFQKLERVGKFTFVRPSSQSAYPKSSPELWDEPDAIYIKNDKGSGKWKFNGDVPESFVISLKGNSSPILAKIKLTPFGHLGIFPEQVSNWDLLQRIGKKRGKIDEDGKEQDREVLNMFAYSGLSTVAALKAGFSVCHVDASKGMTDWAKENAVTNEVADKKVRWIIDDAVKFVKREIRRKKKYAGFILDPPSFGRGAKGEVWKIEDDLPELLDLMMELCDADPEFIILSCHTSGYSPLILERMLSSRISIGHYNSFELVIPEDSGFVYPSGFCSIYRSEI